MGRATLWDSPRGSSLPSCAGAGTGKGTAPARTVPISPTGTVGAFVGSGPTIPMRFTQKTPPNRTHGPVQKGGDGICRDIRKFSRSWLRRFGCLLGPCGDHLRAGATSRGRDTGDSGSTERRLALSGLSAGLGATAASPVHCVAPPLVRNHPGTTPTDRPERGDDGVFIRYPVQYAAPAFSLSHRSAGLQHGERGPFFPDAPIAPFLDRPMCAIWGRFCVNRMGMVGAIHPGYAKVPWSVFCANRMGMVGPLPANTPCPVPEGAFAHRHP